MPEDALAAPWDFLALVAWWNLYGLPALLLAAAVGLVALRRRFPGPRPLVVAVKAMALVHLVLGFRSGLGLAQELLTLREQGIPQSFPVTGIVLPALAAAMHLAIGHGLWRLRGWARRLGIAWDGLTAAIVALVAGWQWKFGVAYRPDRWPDDLVSVVLPWVLLVILLLPGVRTLFRTEAAPGQARDALAVAPWRHSLVAIVVIVLLMIAASTLAVDASDWLVRSVLTAD